METLTGVLVTTVALTTIGCASASTSPFQPDKEPPRAENSVTTSVEYARANAHFETHEYALCIEEATELLKAHPRNIDILGMRSMCLIALKRDNEALDDLNVMADTAPSNARVFTNRALIWRRKNLWDKAVADYSLAISLDPKAHVAYSGRS